MGYSRPARTEGSTQYFKPSNHEGDLLVFRVTQFKQDHPNYKGEPKDTAWADVTVIDGENAGLVYTNQNITHELLAASLRESVGGEPVLARLGRGDQGGRPFWLEDYTDEDQALAEAHFAAAGTEDDEPPF